MLVHVDASDRCLAHAYAGAAIRGDQAAKELKETGIVADDEDILAIGEFVEQFLEIGECGVWPERCADLNLAFVAEFVAHKLSRLQGTLQGAGDDQIGLHLEGAENAAHDHALFLAFGDQPALGIELRIIARNSRIGMPHEIEVHGRGLAFAGSISASSFEG